MKKSVKVRVICLIVAAMMLGSAVAVAAVLGSPYETLKRAVLDALTERNVTEEIHATLTVNDKLIEESRSYRVNGDDSSISNIFDKYGNVENVRYTSSGLDIFPQQIKSYDGIAWYSAYVYPRRDNYYRRNEFNMFTAEDRSSAQMRFMELAADALIGDLKNNVTMTSENGIRYVQGTLTESQVPELAKAGIDMLIEQSGGYYGRQHDISFDGREYVYEHVSIERGMKTVRRWKQNVRPMTDEETKAWENGYFHELYASSDYYFGITYIADEAYIPEEPEEFVNEYKAPATRADYYDNGNPLDLPMQSLVINYVHGEAEIDMKGNLLSCNVSATATITDIFGEVSVLELKASARFSDIGTSNPVCHIPGATQLLTSQYLKERFGYDNMHVYFTLNEDGSINESSITTTHPGDKYGNRLEYTYDSPAVPVPSTYGADDTGDDPEDIVEDVKVEDIQEADVADAGNTVDNSGDVGKPAQTEDVGDVEETVENEG